MHILFVSPEVFPFAKTGGLADVLGILPQALTKLKHKCSVILPLHRQVRKNAFKPELVQSDVQISVGSKLDSFNLCFARQGDVDVYFVEKDEYYDRDYLYGTPHRDYPDNAMRYSFFAKSVLYSIPYIGRPDMLHLNDWQTALTPLYLKLFFKEEPHYKNIKTLFTVHNLAYQGLFEKEFMVSLDLPESLFNMHALEFYGKISFIKAGILYSDAVSTVSETYAREILTEELGCGLAGLLRTREKDLYGILNGVDYSVWNPATDKVIYKNYDKRNLKPKLECKIDLLKQFNIRFDRNKPLIGMITRLAEQKGVDLVAGAMKDMLELGVNFILLGTGDEKYNRLFEDMEATYKGEVGVRVVFDDALAHKIEAGCDMFLMPSRYEPCGLNQMYSLKYATVPIVRAVGGLEDTIREFDPSKKKGNGFKFKEPTTEALLCAVKKAVNLFKDRNLWNALLQNCLACDFSWNVSAKKYSHLYQKIFSGHSA